MIHLVNQIKMYYNILEIEWSNMRRKLEHDRALDQLIVDLGTGKEYCLWLSAQSGLHGIAPKIIEKKLN